MIKFFLLALMAWLVGIPGADGLVLIVGFFLYVYCAFSIRWRGYYGKKALKDTDKTLSLSQDMDKHDMRSQWDVIPWPGTAEHVVRKWTWDKIALDERLKKNMVVVSATLDKALKNLGAFVDPKKGSLSATKSNVYSQTLAVVDPSHVMAHSPNTALALLSEVFTKANKEWTNQAICTLGGTFIICAEGFKGDIRTYFKEHSDKFPKGEPPRMAMGTVEETSRMTWKAGQIFLNFSVSAVKNFVTAALARINPWDKHAVIKYKEAPYYAPTTMFGASATIMKVMNLCEVIGMDNDEKLIVTYAVAMHWIDKYLNDSSWFNGGTFAPDRHSLIEALQGAYAFITGNPNQAAIELATMYEEADQARLKLEKKKDE